jgi:hypothetical protein
MSEKTVQNEKVEVKLIVRAVQGICLCCVLMIMSEKQSRMKKWKSS